MNTLSENLQRKKKLAETISFSSVAALPHSFHLNLHEVPLKFSFASENLVQMIFDQYPLHWLIGGQNQKSLYEIEWVDSEKWGWSPEDWEDEPRFECETYQENGRTIALHRDFVAVVEKNKVLLIAPYTLADGFYNFLRWLIPLHFVEQGKLLIHSSCVIGPGHKAYFCLGPSGAGKSTIASLAPRSRVLGDDMNVLKVEDGKCWAQAGALGQSVTNPKEYNNWYEVGGFFWLKKAQFFEISELTQPLFAKHLYQSVANVFWDQIDEEKMSKIVSLVTLASQSSLHFELKFAIEPDIWPQIFLKLSADRKSTEISI